MNRHKKKYQVFIVFLLCLLSHWRMFGKLTLTMVIKNEASRYLKRVLESHREYIDEAVIIDDGSTDDSVKVCQEVLKGIPLHIISNKESKFSNGEISLRKQQWKETLKTNPDWILNMDADEMFESTFKDQIKVLMQQKDVYAYCFRLYDFWDEEHYRDDQYWCAHNYSRSAFLIKYKKDFEYKWREAAQHCFRFPINILHLPYSLSTMRIKHYGWACKEDRIKKYKKYISLDPDGKYGWKEQYESILDKNPRLIKWVE